jgi:hypothetical protein
MDTPLKTVMIGLILGMTVAVLYYPTVVSVGLLSYFATTPPPRGPLPSETCACDTAFRVLSYSSRPVGGPGGGSVWSVVNLLGHGAMVGAAGGVLSSLFWMTTRKGRRPHE